MKVSSAIVTAEMEVHMDRFGELARKAKEFERELQAWAVSSKLIKPSQPLYIRVGVPVPTRHDVPCSSGVILDLHYNFINRPLNKLGLSRRILNTLAKAGVKTLGDLLRLEKSPHLSVQGIGRAATQEIKRKISEAHIPFAANWE